MLVQFNVVKDKSAWLIDTVAMNYIHSDGLAANSNIIERGKLIFIGMQGVIRIFALEGRTIGTDGPGAGFCTFGYAIVDLDTTITFYLHANVAIENINSVRPIESVRYELIPTGGSNEGNETAPGKEEPEGSGVSSEETPVTEPTAPEASVQPGN
jgi:hypothetical protein